MDKAEVELKKLYFNIPDGLNQAIAQRIDGTSTSWDEALWEIVNGEE